MERRAEKGEGEKKGGGGRNEEKLREEKIAKEEKDKIRHNRWKFLAVIIITD